MKYLLPFFSVISIYALIFIVGCSSSEKSLTKTPVFIHPELTMKGYMASADVVDNLADELSMTWSMKIAVKQISGKEIREVDSGESALSAHNDGFEPIDASLYPAHQYALIQCRAITIAVKMAPSNISYLNGSLDKTAISELPVAVAFIPSKSQKLSIEANSSFLKLEEVTPITGFAQVNNYEVKLQIDGGSQTMIVLAKGDTNGDGIEDLLMQVINAAEGGSYRVTRLFLLSKNKKDGRWLLLSEY